MDWLEQFWASLTWGKIALGTLAIVVSAIASYGAVILAVVKIPADYFSPSYALNRRADRHFLFRWCLTILKNIVGFLLVIAGFLMILGPGPGVLTILLGLILMDIPGKRPLEISLIKRPAVLSVINNLRSRYQKAPLILD